MLVGPTTEDGGLAQPKKGRTPTPEDVEDYDLCDGRLCAGAHRAAWVRTSLEEAWQPAGCIPAGVRALLLGFDLLQLLLGGRTRTLPARPAKRHRFGLAGRRL